MLSDLSFKKKLINPLFDFIFILHKPFFMFRIDELLPERIFKIISSDIECISIISQAISSIGDILEENNLFFFPEYTNHGIKHIKSVINSANSIIPDSAFSEFMDAQNASALILSILLHDLGMHYSFDAFVTLISNNSRPLIPLIDKLSWKELWDIYINDCKKLSTKDKVAVFGVDLDITEIDLRSIGNLKEFEKTIIGEFIRRHHPRLAHEIALNGINTSNKKVDFFEGIREINKKDIFGVIARSHGMNIRHLYDYIDKKYGNRKCYKINIIYLMVILRIADYLQIDQSRLNRTSIDLKTFSNPISKLEHYKHIAIEFMETKDEDPETLYVFAQPHNSTLYFNCKELLENIQSELDRSWNILGENYGRDLIKPQIRYRRITSNIFNLEVFQESINYIPEKILFDAHDDLSKLLVSPLYGDEPTYGIRELLQNSIDACRERALHDENYVPAISVSITYDNDLECAVLKIKDNGKGMDVFEIKSYFLKAGASLRKSATWHKENTGLGGKSLVARSGKFGVGVLAAFLIGSEITVKTKKLTSKFGLIFKANIDSKEIEIYKDYDIVEGTEIICPIDKNALLKLEAETRFDPEFIYFDKWYTIAEPKIRYFAYFQDQTKLGYEFYDPCFSEKDNQWIEFQSQNYTKIRWSYSNDFNEYINSKKKYRLTCNGIVIPNPPDFFSDIVRAPNVQVFDFDGLLPLNLNRNSLNTYSLPFIDDLKTSIFKEILTKYVMNESISSISADIIHLMHFKQNTFSGFLHNEINPFHGCFLEKKGFILNHHFFTKFIKGRTYLKFFLQRKVTPHKLSYDIGDHLIYISENESIYGYDRTVLRRIIFNEEHIEKNTDDSSKPMLQHPNIWTDENLTHMTKHGWHSYRKKDEKSKNNIFLGRMTQAEKENISAIGEAEVIDLYDNNLEFINFLALVFHDYDDCVFPFDLEERFSKLTQLFGRLEENK